ncbi:TAP-like protein-domain-containing protein [Microdochium trichocladiopsis]|uniref:TAP-like protein-domain-containing protein n=1 Tax=Microdochium trichocladiopsis TaxID=1682393 RepID=A0A9P9BLH4_9PEZI|nr:TAP-like protein-domain-containing protein [Microdochium trichocladiopsis]KAH7028087.1 TAP-like protein-domain-containing protein [Microdochium trichocladiopsis]
MMHSITTWASALLLPLAATTAAAAALPRADGIVWGECHIEEDTSSLPVPVQCGKLTVPLDWSGKTTDKTIDIELIKWPAATQPAPKGSILLNFGGPGGDGLNNFVSYAPLQAPIIGDEHDIISWDPRGTRNAIPVICYNNTATNAELTTYLSDWYNASDTTPSHLWTEATVLSELCQNALQEVGPYVGMASVARDIIAIVDALGEDGLLRYWGISGGTSMGATVAAMFPDRVDKVILDGVMNAHQYYNSPVETEFISSADDVLRGIFNACIEAGVEKCPLASHAKTCGGLEEKMDQLVYELKYNPIPFASAALGSGGIVDYSILFNWLFSKLYVPKSYATVAKVLEGLFRRDATALVEAALIEAGASTPAAGPIIRAVWGIRCGDKRPRADSKEELEPYVDQLEANSRWFAHFGLASNAYLCAQWPFEAVERYEGDFTGVKTKNPVLFIGNTYDPVTPLVSARNMSSGFEGSVLLQHDSYGHVSFTTQKSNCTEAAISAYLNEGKLPAEGTVCKPNLPIVNYVTGEI